MKQESPTQNKIEQKKYIIIEQNKNKIDENTTEI